MLVALMVITTIPCTSAEAANTGKPTILSVSKTEAKKARISWKSVKEADGYEVYCKVNKGNYTRVKITDSTSAVITKLSSKKKYSFKVRAFSINRKGEISYGKYSNAKSCDMTRPATVSVKAAKQNADHSVSITWKKQSGVSGFYIYRKNSKSGTFKKIATVKGASKTSFKDTKIEVDKTYYYAVKAYKGKKVSENLSEVLKISVSYQDTEKNYGQAGLNEGELYCDISGAVVDSTEDALFTVYFKAKPTQKIFLFRDDQRYAEMKDDGTNGDEVAGDGIYSILTQISSSKEDTFRFIAKYGEKKTNVIELKVYQKASEAEVGQSNQYADIIFAAADPYTNRQGFVDETSYHDAINAVYTRAMEYREKGIVDWVSKDENSVSFSFVNGFKYVYQPKLEGMDAVGRDVSVSVLSMQPWKVGYETTRDKETAELDTQCTDGASEKIAGSFNNYSWDYNLDDADVTLDVVKNITANQVILWHGHGGYNAELGPYILTGEDYKSQYLADWFAGRIAVTGDGKVCFTAAFVNKYVSDCTNTFVYLACCESGRDASLANAFLNKGAAAVVANTRTIYTKYNCKMESAVVDGLLCLDENSKYYYTLGQSLTYAKSLHGTYDGPINKAETVIFGDGGYRLSDECKAKLEIDQPAVKLHTGNKTTLTATTDGDASLITWSSEDPSVVKVEASGSTATLTGQKDGETVITCSIGNIVAKCPVRVESSLSLHATSVSGKEGNDYYIFAHTGASSVRWKSSNSNVASVSKITDKIAKITFKQAGEAVIYCYAGSQCASCKVKVTAASKPKLSLSVNKITIKKGDTVTITAMTNASSVKWTQNGSGEVRLSSGSKKTITVTGKTSGIVILKCSAGGKTVTCSISVVDVCKDGYYTSLLTGTGKRTVTSSWGEIYPSAYSFGIYPSNDLFSIYGSYAKITNSGFNGDIGTAVSYGVYHIALADDVKIYFGKYEEAWEDDTFDDSEISYDAEDPMDAEYDGDTNEDDLSDLEYDDSLDEEISEEISIEYNVWTSDQFENYYSSGKAECDSYVKENKYNRGVTLHISDGKVVEIFCWEYCNK